jgi:hypothetical protein
LTWLWLFDIVHGDLLHKVAARNLANHHYERALLALVEYLCR